MTSDERIKYVEEINLVIRMLEQNRVKPIERQTAVRMLEAIAWQLEPRTPTGHALRDLRT